MKGVKGVNHAGRTFQLDWRPMEQGQMTKGRVVDGLSEVVGLSMSELLLSSQGDADVTGNC